jgi:hypothetical protein
MKILDSTVDRLSRLGMDKDLAALCTVLLLSMKLLRNDYVALTSRDGIIRVTLESQIVSVDNEPDLHLASEYTDWEGDADSYNYNTTSLLIATILKFSELSGIPFSTLAVVANNNALDLKDTRPLHTLQEDVLYSSDVRDLKKLIPEYLCAQAVMYVLPELCSFLPLLAADLPSAHLGLDPDSLKAPKELKQLLKDLNDCDYDSVAY